MSEGFEGIDDVKSALLRLVRNDFSSHVPDQPGKQLIETLRKRAGELAELYVTEVPHGRDLIMALERLEEASRCAIAGVAKQFPMVP